MLAAFSSDGAADEMIGALLCHCRSSIISLGIATFSTVPDSSAALATSSDHGAGWIKLRGGRMIQPSSSPTATKSPFATQSADSAQIRAARSS